MLLMRQERLGNGWTQKYVSEQIGLTRTAVHDIETGRQKPSYDVLIKLLDLFGYNDPRKLFAVISEQQSTPGGNSAVKMTTTAYHGGGEPSSRHRETVELP